MKNSKKAVIAMSSKQSLTYARDATGQAGGIKKQVIIAMSGGVDSSVAAALLKKQGFNVVGVFMKFWKPRINTDETDLCGFENKCCTPASEKRARLVAKKIGIPFYVFNFEKEFKKRIVDYFLKAHQAGITPNPCVICNKEIKFGLLLKKALKLGADYIATGHYARLKREIPNPPATRDPAQRDKSQFPNKSEISIFKLLKGRDKNKDQSYFLWQLNQKQLKHILFPVGDYTKDEVRKLAKKFNLPTANASESMEICFIQNTVNEFLKKSLLTRPGLVVDKNKKIIGRHDGLYFYTIGQRRGIKINREQFSAKSNKRQRTVLCQNSRIMRGKPFYVLNKDAKKNLLIVTQNEKDLLKKELSVKNVNWIHPVKCRKAAIPLGALSGTGLFNRVRAKIRYRNEGVSATIKKQKGKIKVIFSKPQRAITPGQSAVFFRGGEILGGGIII